MRYYLLPAIILIFLYTSIISGCGKENKDLRIGKLEEQVKTLRVENAKLRKDCALNTVKETGSLFTISMTAISIFIINNLIWIVVYRRKK
jgi:hypothetical protein